MRFETKYSLTDHSIIVRNIIKKKNDMLIPNSIYEFTFNTLDFGTTFEE